MRIRTVTPGFWEDDAIGMLSRDARLLFIATWNMADDEGILRWNAEYLKSQAFMYDDDITATEVGAMMRQLVELGLVFPYKGGKTGMLFGLIVKFRKHQKINRPTPSKLPPPSIQSREVRAMYFRRDDWTCHLCGERVAEWFELEGLPVPTIEVPRADARLSPRALTVEGARGSLDHLTPRIEGGLDYPSNLRTSHLSCNQARKDSPLDSVSDPVSGSVPSSQWEEEGEEEALRSAPGSVSDSVTSDVSVARAALDAGRVLRRVQ